jgi:hypothetical protein
VALLGGWVSFNGDSMPDSPANRGSGNVSVLLRNKQCLDPAVNYATGNGLAHGSG